MTRSYLFFQARCLLFILAMCVCPLMAQDDSFALLVQKSPEYGGVVTPSETVQTSGGDRLVTITATPRDGYEFVYWLGDVTTPTNSVTTVFVDTPKMVIAIFERPEKEKFAETILGGSSKGSNRSPGGAVSSVPRGNSLGVAPPAFGGGYTGSSTEPEIIIYYPNDPDGPDGPDVPGNPDVPEPATMLMLGAGAIILIRKRKFS